MMALVQFLMEGVLAAALGIFGIVGNIVSIKVLSSKDLDMLPTFRHLLKMLAAFDATFLFFALTFFCVSSWSDDYNDFVRPWLSPYWLPVIQICLTGSVWTTTAVSVERYLTVCLGYRSNSVQHLFYTLPIVSFSLIFNVPRFFELRTVMDVVNETDTTGGEVNVSRPRLEPTELRNDLAYSRDYVLIANSVALAFVPMLALFVLNACIYRTIAIATRRHNAISSQKRRDHKVAMMLVIVVVVFVICHSIRSIINTYECIQYAAYGELKFWPEWIQFLVHLNHLALVVNSSINILIYAWKDDKFYNVLMVTVGLRGLTRKNRSESTPDLERTAVTTVVAQRPIMLAVSANGRGNGNCGGATITTVTTTALTSSSPPSRRPSPDAARANGDVATDDAEARRKLLRGEAANRSGNVVL